MNHPARANLPPVPERMRHLPITERGFPVPYFVDWVDGKPDFRVMDGRKWVQAVRFKKCWLCGESLGRFLTFVVGPMCAVNRVSSEPPSHRECAQFAVRACPFLAMPKARRREDDLPEGWEKPAGEMIMRNPGVTLLWTTKVQSLFKAPKAGGGMGHLIAMGPAVEVEWFREGRPATREEVLESFRTGCPALEEKCQSVDDRAMLDKCKAEALELIPRAA